MVNTAAITTGAFVRVGDLAGVVTLKAIPILFDLQKGPYFGLEKVISPGGVEEAYTWGGALEKPHILGTMYPDVEYLINPDQLIELMHH